MYNTMLYHSKADEEPYKRTVWQQAQTIINTPIKLSIPRYRLSTYGLGAFSVAGPTVWNSLPEDLWDPVCCADSYRHFYFHTSVFSALEVFLR